MTKVKGFPITTSTAREGKTTVIIATAPMMTGAGRPTTQTSKPIPIAMVSGIKAALSASMDNIPALSRATVPATATRCLSKPTVFTAR